MRSNKMSLEDYLDEIKILKELKYQKQSLRGCFGANSDTGLIIENEIAAISCAIERLQEKVYNLYPEYIGERIKQLDELLSTKRGLWEEYDDRKELELLINKWHAM